MLPFLNDFKKKVSKMQNVSLDAKPPAYWNSVGNYAVNKILSGSYSALLTDQAAQDYLTSIQNLDNQRLNYEDAIDYFNKSIDASTSLKKKDLVF